MTSKFLAATVSGLAALATASGAFAQAAAPAAPPGADAPGTGREQYSARFHPVFIKASHLAGILSP